MNIKVDEDDVVRVLKSYVKNEDMMLLLRDLLVKTHPGIEWFFKIHLGHKYPKIPEIGTKGYINLNTYTGWGGDKVAYLESEFNEQGFIPVTVKSFEGLGNYHPLKVEAPELQETKGNNIFSIDVDSFILDDDFFLYDKPII